MIGISQQFARLRRPAVFGLSAAISRAGGILAVPIAAQILSLDDLGYYALCVAFIQLLCQFLSLGGSVAVSQAGAENAAEAQALAARFSIVAASLGLAMLLPGWISRSQATVIAGYVALIAALEAHQQLYQLVIRARERENLFLSTSIVKAFAWPASVLIYILFLRGGRTDLPIETLLVFQLAVYAATSLGFVAVLGSPLVGRLSSSDGFRKAVLLSLPMTVHAFAQWIMSSSDRVVLKEFSDGETLAFYSLAYSIASIMFVLVSGMALYLPHEIMKRIELWGAPAFRLRFVRLYAVAYTALFSLLLLAYSIDYRYTNILRYRDPDMFLVIGIVGTAFLFTGVYHLYVPFLFAAGRTNSLTKQTLKSCVAYVIAIVPLVYFLGAIGAAIGTLAVWAYYMASIRHHAVAYLAEIGIPDDKVASEWWALLAVSCVALTIAISLYAALG